MPTLEWIGKEKVINHDKEVPFRILEPKYTYDSEGKHKGVATSDNMIIHGDNLLALKALLPKYRGKIKCIYIDPPYNTGKEGWIYNDNVNDPQIKKWLGEVVGKEGDDLSRHDKWLCMMYPRLKILQELLSEDGIIFISIDDNEQANLKLICDEIFGARNLFGQLIWRSDGNFDNQAKVKVCHEYIISYMKNIIISGLPNGYDPTTPSNSKIFKTEIRNTVVKNGSKNPMSEIVLPKGFPSAIKDNIIKARNNAYPIYYEDAEIENYALKKDTIVKSGWASKDQLEEFIKSGFNSVEDSKGQTTRFEITASGTIEIVKTRNRISHVMSILSGLGSTQSMSQALSRINIDFDFPKPTQLIEYLAGFYTEQNEIVLDAFAGSGTTAHAVLNMNKQDGGNRKFILVELGDYAETVTAERVRRVIDGYGEGKNAVDGTGGSFTFYELGPQLFDENGNLNEEVATDRIREYIWFTETQRPLASHDGDNKAFLGVAYSCAYYFHYDKDATTTLDHEFMATIKTKADSYVIYADVCSLDDDFLSKHHITFKKIPRDIARI